MLDRPDDKIIEEFDFHFNVKIQILKDAHNGKHYYKIFRRGGDLLKSSYAVDSTAFVCKEKAIKAVRIARGFVTSTIKGEHK